MSNMITLSKIFVAYVIYLCLFERLHRYVYDYVFQSKNSDFGLPTKYVIANRHNKYEPYNERIQKVYDILLIRFWRWRHDIVVIPYKKYQRYK